GRAGDGVVLRIAVADRKAVAARSQAVVRSRTILEPRADQIDAEVLVETVARADGVHVGLVLWIADDAREDSRVARSFEGVGPGRAEPPHADELRQAGVGAVARALVEQRIGALALHVLVDAEQLRMRREHYSAADLGGPFVVHTDSRDDAAFVAQPV